jgi:hypothetical protein
MKRVEKEEREDARSTKASSNSREEVDKAEELGLILSKIDSMSVQDLLDECKKNELELNGELDQSVLKKRLKGLVLAKYT